MFFVLFCFFFTQYFLRLILTTHHATNCSKLNLPPILYYTLDNLYFLINFHKVPHPHDYTMHYIIIYYGCPVKLSLNLIYVQLSPPNLIAFINTLSFSPSLPFFSLSISFITTLLCSCWCCIVIHCCQEMKIYKS